MRAALYLRVSLDLTGERLAVTRQREAGMKIAADRGWDVVKEYEDNSISASDSTKVRPAYDEMVRDYRAGKFDALICWDLDRLTRQPRQLEDWIDAAEGRGLAIVTSNGEADLTTDGGRMYARIKAAVARAEVERKGARQSAGQRQRAEMGRPPRGVRQTGYTLDGEIIDDEAQFVRELFHRFAAGETIYGLTKWANTLPVKPRKSDRWVPSTVLGMLRSARYAGRSMYRGKVVGVAQWPGIIDDTLFDQVQVKLSDPRRVTNGRDTSRKHLGSNIYVCGVCGSTVRCQGTQEARGVREFRYTCRNACLTRMGTRIDEYVAAVLRERLSLPDVRSLLVREADSEELDRLKAERREYSARIEQIASDYDDGLIDARRWREATEKVQARLDGVRRAEMELGGVENPVMGAADPVAAFDEATLDMKRETLRLLLRVELVKIPRGPRGFHPDSVRISAAS